MDAESGRPWKTWWGGLSEFRRTSYPRDSFTYCCEQRCKDSALLTSRAACDFYEQCGPHFQHAWFPGPALALKLSSDATVANKQWAKRIRVQTTTKRLLTETGNASVRFNPSGVAIHSNES